jgi:hypothetical protein
MKYFKSSLSFAFVLTFLAPFTGNAQSLFDNFSGTSVNSNLWAITLPYSDSSVTEGGGVVSIENNGRLTTQVAMPSSYSVSGEFLMANNPYSNFKVVLRADGTLDSTEAEGIAFQFQIETDGGDTSENLRIFSIGNPAGDFTTPEVTANLTLNSWNTFLITDNGYNLNLYFDGASTPTVSANSTFGVGNLVTFYNREGAAAGSSISANGVTELNYINIQTVPEPCSFAMIGLGALTLARLRMMNGQRK